MKMNENHRKILKMSQIKEWKLETQFLGDMGISTKAMDARLVVELYLDGTRDISIKAMDVYLTIGKFEGIWQHVYRYSCLYAIDPWFLPSELVWYPTIISSFLDFGKVMNLLAHIGVKFDHCTLLLIGIDLVMRMSQQDLVILIVDF